MLPCLFDRLIRSLDRAGPSDSRSLDKRAYRNAIRRDLEWLLNSKRRLTRQEAEQGAVGLGGRIPAEDSSSIYEHEELPTSVLNYGVRDYNGSAVNPSDERIIEGIRSEVRNAIRRFEPRIIFESLRVELVEDSTHDSVLTFSIEAELWALPEWESLRIDIDLNSGSCQVKEGAG